MGKLNIALCKFRLQKPMENSSGVISLAFCGCCRVGDNFQWNICSESKNFNRLARFSISTGFRWFSFCRSCGFLVLQKITDSARFAQHALFGMGSSRRNVWNIQETNEKTHTKYLGVRPPLARQQALSELRFCRILQNSAESAEIYGILQNSAECQNRSKSWFLQQ